MRHVPPAGERASGVLLHPTSLPGRFGSGDLGPFARAFADFLAAAGQTWWQMLPICPPGFGGSPYDSAASFAGSPWLISLEDLVERGLLEPDEIAEPPHFANQHVDHEASQALRDGLLRRAFARHRAHESEADRRELDALRAGGWLDAWALFSALKAACGGTWTEWPEALRRREPDALERAHREHADEIAYHEFVQLEFGRQWRRLAHHCRLRGIRLLGDVPMFVAHDGADVWANQELFFLDAAGQPTAVAGVPPDAFSEIGQFWGNPVYRWQKLSETGFSWWVRRLFVTLERFDAVRLDHFIGFRNYWEIPAGAADARAGHWVDVPGEAFFERVRKKLDGLPFIAEDLGAVTRRVSELRERFDLPGMRVLQFAFGSEESNDYRPHRYERNTVVYTGTHDNDTTVSWFADASADERARVLRYLGVNGAEINWELVRAALASVANLAIFPLQDVLGVGAEGRMNVPGTTVGNWRWRASLDQLSPEIAGRLRRFSLDYERALASVPGDAAAFLRCSE